MTVRERIRGIAQHQGLDPDDMLSTLARAIGDAARTAWGERDLETSYDEEADAVVIYQVVRVVERVDPSRRTKEIPLEAASALEGQIGDELLFQVFYRDEDGLMAAGPSPLPAGVLPSLDALAEGLPVPADAPSWIVALWPRRRMPWRFGRPVTLPPLTATLQYLLRWLEDEGVEVDVAGSSSEEIAKVSGLGEGARDLALLYERLGPRGNETPSLTIFGCPLLPIRSAIAQRREMTALVEQGVVPRSSWKSSWLPVFGGQFSPTSYCLDLETGAMVRWDEDGPPEQQAHSLATWLGLVATAAECGLMRWSEGVGMHCPGTQWELFVELRARAFST